MAVILCLTQEGYEAAWALAEGAAPPKTVLHRPRRTPWLAAMILPAFAAVPRDMQLLAAWLEMAIAWRLLRDYEAGETRRIRQPPPDLA